MLKNSTLLFLTTYFFGDLRVVFQIYPIRFGKMYATEMTCDKEKEKKVLGGVEK